MSSVGPFVTESDERVDFFISRAGESKAWGLWVARELLQNGYSVVYQDHDFGNGEMLTIAIGNANRNSERTLLLLSDSYWDSKYTRMEYAMAVDRQQLLVFRVTAVELRPELSVFIYNDLFNLSEEQARKTLLDAVRNSYGAPKYPHSGELPDAVLFPGSVKGVTIPIRGTPKVGRDVLENVAYLCDRMPQENALQAILAGDPGNEAASWQGSVICIAHGHEIERVERFVSRLSSHTVPRWIPKKDRPIRDVFVEWPKVTRSTTVETFRRDLRLTADNQMVQRKLDGGAVAIVRSNLLVAPWCNELGMKLIEAFVEYWHSFQCPSGSLLIVCLMVRYPAEQPPSFMQRVQRWVSSSSDVTKHMLLALESGSLISLNCHVLPKLDPIERPEAEGWTEKPEVRRYRHIEFEEIRQIYKDATSISMGDLAPSLLQLLTSPKGPNPS